MAVREYKTDVDPADYVLFVDRKPVGIIEEKHYNLDMIISVGYRVNSIRGPHFRIWATQQLKKFIIKGFVLNNEKLKNPDNPFGQDYFDELPEVIRDIRSSGKRSYRKITDIYALVVDYSPKAEETQMFFNVVQNKLIFAATGNTAAEVIANRSDETVRNMGLTSWQGNNVRKKDVTVSKNYLNQHELDILNRIVTMYLVPDRERNRSEGKSGLKKIFHNLRRIVGYLTKIMGYFGQKSFWKGFSCKPTWMWASIRTIRVNPAFPQ